MDGKRVTFRGPLFDGRAARAVRDFSSEFPEGYADDVNSELQQQFSQVFRKSTGHYARQIRNRRTSTKSVEVVGNVTPYGAWLEGVSPRNRKTRFKGYHSFLIVGQRMDRRAEAAANKEFRMKYLRKLK